VDILASKEKASKVSVAVLVQGDLSHARRALDSVAAQTYENTELIVVHHSSISEDARAKELAKSYGKKVKYYQKKDEGIAASINFAIQQADGTFFSWLLQNDVYKPEKIEKEIEAIGSKNDVIAISGWTKANQHGRILQTFAIDPRIEAYPQCVLALIKDPHLNTSAMLFPTKLLDKIKFEESSASSHDYVLLSGLIKVGATFKRVSEPLFQYSSLSEDRYLNDPRIVENRDFFCSELINTLNYNSILDYYASEENANNSYGDLLQAGYPRSAAFLLDKLVRGSIERGDNDGARAILLATLSDLPEAKMASSSSDLLAKISRPSGKKKILFSSAHWLTGGMERVMSVLFRELHENYEIFLITPYDSRKSHIAIPDYVTSVKISDDRFQRHFDSMILTYALLLDIDVVVGLINLFKKQLNAYELCVGTKIKTIASNHEYYFYPYKSPVHYDVVEKRLAAYQTCDAIIWPNGFNAALCGMYVDRNYVIGNPNNFEVVGKLAPRDKKVVIGVGRFDDYVKRVDRMLKCFSLVLKKVPDAKLVLVGRYDKNAPVEPGTKTTINDLIEELALPPESVEFTGEVNNVQDYYAAASVMMLTSNSEGFGMVLNEAACFGVPAVGNYIPGIEDLITDGQNGYVTNQGDLEAMALHVSEILSNDTLHKKLAKNAMESAKSYDASHIGNEWKYLIDTLTDGRKEDVIYDALQKRLGYSVQDWQLFSKVLARELNEVFQHTTSGASQHISSSEASVILRKIKGLPRRLKANIAHEGLPRTVTKVVTRTYRVARMKLGK
jgi:glycosyltransferase involved in cell wall biosynthesis